MKGRWGRPHGVKLCGVVRVRIPWRVHTRTELRAPCGTILQVNEGENSCEFCCTSHPVAKVTPFCVLGFLFFTYFISFHSFTISITQKRISHVANAS